MDDVDAVRKVFAEALARMDRGRAQYGPFDPAADGRDLLLEAEEELLDAINYVAMFVLKIRLFRRRNQYDQ